MVLLSSMRLIFSLFDEFWIDNDRIVLQKLVISNFFSVKIFKKRFLSVFQEFFTEISLGALVCFVSVGSMFQEYIS